MEQEEKKRSKREDENENPRRNDEGGGDGMPRFSFTWIYVLVGLALLGLQMSKMMGSPQKTEWPQLEQVPILVRV